MANKKTSKNEQANYARYASENREEKNRLAKLTRHALKFPNDAQAQAALVNFERSGVPHRRKKPVGDNTTTPRQYINLESSMTLAGEELAARLRDNAGIKEKVRANTVEFYAASKLQLR